MLGVCQLASGRAVLPQAVECPHQFASADHWHSYAADANFAGEPSIEDMSSCGQIFKSLNGPTVQMHMYRVARGARPWSLCELQLPCDTRCALCFVAFSPLTRVHECASGRRSPVAWNNVNKCDNSDGSQCGGRHSTRWLRAKGALSAGISERLKLVLCQVKEVRKHRTLGRLPKQRLAAYLRPEG